MHYGESGSKFVAICEGKECIMENLDLNLFLCVMVGNASWSIWISQSHEVYNPYLFLCVNVI